MDWVFYLIGITMLVVVAFTLIAIILATKLSPPRVTLGPINPLAGAPPPPATPPAAPPVPPVAAPAPAAAAAAPARRWWPTWNFSWIRTGTRATTSAFTGASFVSVLLAIAAIAAMVWLLQQPGLVQPSTTPPPIFTASGGGGFFDSTDSWSFWLGFAAIVMVIVAFVVADRLKLVTFLFVTILVLIVYYLYKQGELDISHRRHILYILAIAAAILVLKYATKFSERLTFGILVGALFAMLGFSHIYTWDQFTNMFTWPTWQSRQQVAGVPNTTAACDGKLTVYEYSPGVIYRVNGPTCQLRAYVMSGCVTWLDINKRTLGKTCTGPLPSIPGVQHMRADSVAVVRLNHCQNYARSSGVVDTCS